MIDSACAFPGHRLAQCASYGLVAPTAKLVDLRTGAPSITRTRAALDGDANAMQSTAQRSLRADPVGARYDAGPGMAPRRTPHSELRLTAAGLALEFVF